MNEGILKKYRRENLKNFAIEHGIIFERRCGYDSLIMSVNMFYDISITLIRELRIYEYWQDVYDIIFDHNDDKVIISFMD